MNGYTIPPGQPALRRRIRTHPESLAAQRAVLAGNDDQRLRGLAHQSTGEPAIALLDAWAVVADVVCFYSERLATEGYLRTATERRSVRELARTLGHELRPGVAARTDLVFAVEDADGASRTAVVPAGTPVQSVPGPGEVPQVFETSAEFTAHAAWNGIRAVASEPQVLGYGDRQVWLDGRHPELRPGDVILVVGDERLNYRAGESEPDDVERFDLRHLTAVEVDPPGHAGWTLLALDHPLGFLPDRPLVATENQRVWHLTEHAQLFGATAPDPGLLWSGDRGRLPPGAVLASPFDQGNNTMYWAGFELPDQGSPPVIDVDGDHPALTPESWIVLEQHNEVEAYRVKSVAATGASKWAVSGRITRAALDIGERLERFDRRATMVHFGGIELTGARRRPVGAGGPGGQPTAGVLTPDRTLQLGAFSPLLGTGQVVILQGVDAGGEVRTEAATVEDCVHRDGVVELVLTEKLSHAYRADTVIVRGNVVAATHGETVTQVLGSGDGRTSYRTFLLRKGPLTHLRSSTPSGGTPSLEVRVDGVRWHEVQGFAECGAQDRVYRLLRTEGEQDGEGHQPTSIVFGDGLRGAIPPTGDENIVATYRAGLGMEGELQAGQLMLPVRRPHGVRDVVNPLPTVDAAPPDGLDEARGTASQRVRALDRAVSADDYADFARSYSGVGQVDAELVWTGRLSTIVVSIRRRPSTKPGEDPDDEPDDELIDALSAAFEAVRDPRLPFRVLRGEPLGFGVHVDVSTDPDHRIDDVHEGIRSALMRDFAAAVRPLGRPVTAASVMLAVRDVPGVCYCTMPLLSGSGGADHDAAMLIAEGARWENGLLPAQLLAVDPERIEIGELT